MKTTRLTLLVITLLLSIKVFSQEYTITKKDSIVKSSWIFGIGFNVVDDAGSEFTDIFNIEDNWNIVPFPSRVSIGRYFENGLGLEAVGSYNKYKEGKTIDNSINTEEIDYYAVDLRISYDLNKILGQTGFFDPYVGLGIGYTDANNVGRGTYNASVGFRTWFNDRIGLDFNSTGKWAMSTDNATNHIQHAVGVVYQFGIERELSKKGEEKLTQLQELEKEQERIQDSVNSAQKAEQEAKELAERLRREEKQAKLVANEKSKENAEKLAKEKIAKEVAALGNVYFDLNSSYLNKSDKSLLDKLTMILKANPSTVIKITSHTDSRGSEKYNLWLSERRVKRTVDYLNSAGISNSRINIEAKGESVPTNECSDGVVCTEEKHRFNRRCEFMLLSN
ncbi:OmpA family protein [uncultured Croceitalea sp.]|uniref:OmpA family protein n=1 Tax=uncultured Croceitalea sp. TaxID=1798908 RepID=UPI00374F849D